VEGDVEAVAEGLKVSRVRFVMNILHADMQCLDGEVGNMYLGTTSEELKQTKGILATRQADEDFVVLVDELVLSQRLVKSLPEFLFEFHRYVCCCATATY
jgi:hypothetical protein